MQIYLITNLANGMKYVGQTMDDFEHRYGLGKWWMRTHNKLLKNAARSYGHNNFSITILFDGRCDNDALTLLEDKYMKEHNSLFPNGYNFKEAGPKGRNYYNFKKYTLIDSKGGVHNVENLRQFCIDKKLSYTAMLNMVSEISLSSSGFALLGADPKDIFDPNQEWEIEHIATKTILAIKRKDVPDFCEKNSLIKSNFWLILSGGCYVSQGYKLKSTVIGGTIKEKKTKFENVIFVKENSGEEIIVNNIFQFAKENNYSRGSLYKLIKGDAICCYGLRVKGFTKSVKEEKLSRMGMEVELKNIKTGEIILVKNTSEFSRQRGLKINGILSMIAGAVEQYHFWTVNGRNLTNYKFPKKMVYIKLKHEDGTEIDGSNPKDIENKHKICCSQMLQQIIGGKYKNLVKGWSITEARYLNQYYPDWPGITPPNENNIQNSPDNPACPPALLPTPDS